MQSQMASGQEAQTGSSVGRMIRYLLSFMPSAPDFEPRSEIPTSNRQCTLISSSTNPFYDSYYRHLSAMGHGIPIWIPEPNENLSIDYRKRGASSGDVIFFTPDGALDFLSNICLSADHVINSGGVPEGFESFKPELSPTDTRRYQQYGENSYLASKSITKDMGGRLPSGVLFTSSSLEGAILTMPEGAYSEDLTRVSGFHRYLSKNLESWYKYVNEDREWGVKMGELHLVTGVHKSTAWGIATFQFSEETATVDVNLQLKAKDNHPYGVLYSWEYSGITDSPRTGPTIQQRQSLIRNLPEAERDQPFANQCLFVRTVNSAIRDSKEIGDSRADQITCQVDNRTQTDISGNSECIGLRHTSSTSSSASSADTAHSLSGNFNANYSMTLMQNGPAPREHPSKAINDFLLKQKPNGRIAITDDQHWISLLTENDVVLPTGDELLTRLIKSYRIIEDDGIISLEPLIVNSTSEIPGDNVLPEQETPVTLSSESSETNLSGSNSIFALLIGISEYKDPNIGTLGVAASSALELASYLQTTLEVPHSHINLLINQQATYAAITFGLNYLSQDPRIKKGDAIIIYFSGRSTQRKVDTKGFWKTSMQAIAPHDLTVDFDSIGDSDRAKPITDRNLEGMISEIADKNGNNITAIFDCSHSAFITRFSIPEEVSASHILLAACGATEQAYEDRGRRPFTSSLLKLLKEVSVEQLRFNDLLERMDPIPGQTPQCEGQNLDRIVFSHNSENFGNRDLQAFDILRQACTHCKVSQIDCEVGVETAPCKQCLDGGHECVTSARKIQSPIQEVHKHFPSWRQMDVIQSEDPIIRHSMFKETKHQEREVPELYEHSAIGLLENTRPQTSGWSDYVPSSNVHENRIHESRMWGVRILNNSERERADAECIETVR